MKHIKYIFPALALCACASDELPNIPEQPTNSEGKEITFSSIIAENYVQLGEESADKENGTRATVDLETLDALWQKGDIVSISDGTLNYSYSVVSAGTQCNFAVLDGKKELTTSGNPTFCAYYPKEAISGWNGTKVSSMIYTEQKYEENYGGGAGQTFGGYMAASGVQPDANGHVSFAFNLVSSIVDVNLGSLGIDLSTVEAVSIKANNGESLAGQFTYDCSNQAISLSKATTGYTTSGQSDVVTVWVGGQMTTGEDAYVRFYTLPVIVSGGYTITVKTTDGTFYTKSTSTSVGDGSSVRITGQDTGTACQPYYKRLGFGAASSARTGCWMATVPGNTHFTMLSLPCAHDAATSGVGSVYASSAKCQQFTISQQLAMGVRAFDIRPGVGSSNFTIYHGGVSCNTTFSAELTNICIWLDANPSETVFLLVKPEKSSLTGSANANDAWKTGVASALKDVRSHIAMIPSGDGVLTLNDAKGKMVVIAAENTTAEAGSFGVGRVGWGSSYNDKTVVKGSDGNGNFAWILTYQDEYETAANSRLAQLTNFLNNYIAKNEMNVNRIYFNGANTSKEISGKTVNNAIVNSDVFKNSTGRWGILSFDYCGYDTNNGKALLDMIINQNYKYLYKDHTRKAFTSASGSGIGLDVADDEYADDGTTYVKGQQW